MQPSTNSSKLKSLITVIYTTRLLLFSVIILIHTSSFAQAAGFRVLTSQGIEFGIWYPADNIGYVQRLGPFTTIMAKDAPVREGQYQIILFSHGNSGRYRNHYLTTQKLADAGYIVIAPQHQADYLVGGRKTAAALDHRYFELEISLKAVRAHPDFISHITSGPVHGVGYSLGGATIMLASGAGFDSNKSDQHCSQFDDEDAEFCENPEFIFQLIQWFRTTTKLRPTSDPFRNSPLITGKAVLIAPVYQGLIIEDDLSVTNLTVIAITGDNIAKPRFHAEPLEQAVRDVAQSQLKSINGHHYAFIAPFPKWLTDKEDIFIAKDPKGCDRAAFLVAINRIILNALETF